MLAVFFALPQESRDFVARIGARHHLETSAGPLLCCRLGSREIAVFHTGMGEACARARLQQLARSGAAARFECVIAAGFAGGLDASLRPGSLVLDGPQGPLFSRAWTLLGKRVRAGAIATSLSVLETPEAKARFGRETCALAVEMEQAAVADFAHEQGLPLIALRAITDPAEETLPVPGAVWFDVAAQRPRPASLLAWLVVRPWRWAAFARFLRNVRQARHALTAALVELVAGLILAPEIDRASH